MAVKMALAVGFFIVFCVSPGLTASQVVPDGLVYTEVKKTLVRGVQGVVTCRFYGKPFEIYWKKGLTPDDLSPMVVWKDGEISGPRYDDGSCDVDANYSLIFNKVSMADAGRIYCIVNNYKGPLMKNYTDILVLDTAITTNLQDTLQLRQTTFGILQCTVHIKARRISWKKGASSSANESLIVIENNQGVAERSGAGYDEGMYNITQEYALVIKELQIYHEGLYVCEVTDYTGISFRSHTFVNVIAQPLEPFPTIQECLNADQYDSNNCILVVKSGMTLTCQAVKYYPSINLSFLYGSSVLEPSDTREWNNTDGTKNKTITIATGGNKELYTCVASNTPGTNENKSTSVLLHGKEPVKSTLVIVLVLCAALVLIFSVAYFIWRKKQFSHPVLPVNYSSVPRRNSHQEPGDSVVTNLTEEQWKDIERRLGRVLVQQHIRICKATGTESVKVQTIRSENRTALFDSHQMLTDWQQRQTFTYDQYLSAFRSASSDAYTKENIWPSNEELKSISSHLTQESMKEIYKKLHIANRYNDAKYEGRRFDSLCEWRGKASDTSSAEKFKQLCLVLESNNLRGLLPTLRGQYIYKAELVDLAFNLLMHDLLPIAKELDINTTKLLSYRPAFHPSHLELGTIKLLTELYASMKGQHLQDPKRSLFCDMIPEHYYPNVAITGLFEYDMSYGELCSISEAINQRAGRRVQQAASRMLPGPGIKISVELQDVLQLTDQDIADRLDTSHQSTVYKLFKIWKEKPRSTVFNFRAALAHDIRIIQMPDLADEIIAGKYINEQTSLAFIEEMVRGLNTDQIRSLGQLLRGKRHWHTTTPFNEIVKQIFDWVAEWSFGSRGSLSLKALRSVNPMMKAAAKKHRDLNDTLVQHGFLDLAREIMIIEQQQLQRRL